MLEQHYWTSVGGDEKRLHLCGAPAFHLLHALCKGSLQPVDNSDILCGACVQVCPFYARYPPVRLYIFVSGQVARRRRRKLPVGCTEVCKTKRTLERFLPPSRNKKNNLHPFLKGTSVFLPLAGAAPSSLCGLTQEFTPPTAPCIPEK